MRQTLFQLLTVGAAVLAHANAHSPSVTLSTDAKITGTLESNVAGGPVHVFRGIPYAEPPIGQQRWKPSTLKALAADLNATSFGSICPGFTTFDPVSGQYPASEDCLYLNVYAPAGVTRDSKLPVMVWIHGGAFVSGAANAIDGSNLLAAANEKLVVVSFNYRLGVFGFFSNSELLAEGGGANFGLQDQEVAFEWVQKYIQHFGGDPENITAFGESAGAMSIAMHTLARDGDQQLFKRAIMQSGGFTISHDMATPQVQETNTAAMAEAVGCSSAGQGGVLGCLRRADVDSLFDISSSLQWVPTVDGVYMKQMPIQRLLAGKISRVPTIIGTNRDEGWLFTFHVAEAWQFDSFVRSRFSLLSETEFNRLSDLYPASAFLTPHHRAGEVFGDVIFVCPSELYSQTLATDQKSTLPPKSGDDAVVESSVDPLLESSSERIVSTHKAEGAPLYQYYFNFMSSEFGYPLVIHTKDIAYVFNQVDRLPEGDDEQTTVVGHFQHYWTNFATTGSPNGQQRSGDASFTADLVWPTYDATKQQLVIQPTLEIETNSVNIPGHIERCEFWWDMEKRIATEVAFI